MTLDPINIQFRYSHHVLKMNFEGVSQEESLRTPEGGANSLNWVLGHVLTSRNSLLEIVGAKPLWSKDENTAYVRGSDVGLTAANALPVETMLAGLSASQETILTGLERLTPERLAEPAPFSPVNKPDETVGSLLVGLCFHESYHTGQSGVLRRVAGHAGAIK